MIHSAWRAFALFLVAGTAVAAVPDFPINPDVAYSATRVVEAEGQRVEQRYYQQNVGKSRADSDVAGQQGSMILRMDQDRMLMVMPAQRMYVEMSLREPRARDQVMAPPDRDDVVEVERLGNEDVNGVAATKYRVTSRSADGQTTQGHFWVSREHGIPVRMEMTAEGRTGVVELRDLKVGPQPDDLFEVPAGYQKMAMGPGLGGLLGGAAAAGAAPAAPPREAAPPADNTEPTFAEEVAGDVADETKQTTRDEVRRGVRDAVSEGLKGLFGR